MKVLLKLFTMALGVIYFIPSECQNNPFDAVGQGHNDAVKCVLAQLTTLPTTGNKSSTIKNLLQQCYPEQSFEYYPTLTENGVYEYVRSQVVSSRSSQFNHQVDIVESFLVSNPNVASIESFIRNLEAGASTAVPNAELNLYYYFLSIIKYSAKLWLPENMGGEFAIKLIPGYGTGNGGGTVSAINWGKVLCADAAGCVTSAGASLVSTGGAAALPGPGGIPIAGWVGLIGGAGASIGKMI